MLIAAIPDVGPCAAYAFAVYAGCDRVSSETVVRGAVIGPPCVRAGGIRFVRRRRVSPLHRRAVNCKAWTASVAGERTRSTDQTGSTGTVSVGLTGELIRKISAIVPTRISSP